MQKLRTAGRTTNAHGAIDSQWDSYNLCLLKFSAHQQTSWKINCKIQSLRRTKQKHLQDMTGLLHPRTENTCSCLCKTKL